MTSLGGIQKQFANIWATCKAQGYKVDEIIPEDMWDYIQGMRQLKAAQEYIRDIESREKDLQEMNNSLMLDLKAKNNKIAIQMEEYKALECDTQQANRQIEFYKKIADDATIHEERAQRNMSAAMKNQINSQESTMRIKKLEAELEDLKTTHRALLKINLDMADLNTRRHEQMQVALDEKAKQITKLTSRVSEIEMQSDKISKAYDDLIDTLEKEHTSTATTSNGKAMLLRRYENLCSAILSEITPLTQFSRHAFDMLDIYQSLFRSLSNPDSKPIASLPDSLDDIMTAAAHNLHIYQEAQRSAGPLQVPNEEIRRQTHLLAAHAGLMYNSLDVIKDDVTTFLDRLRNAPDACSGIAKRLSYLEKLKRLSLR